MNSVWPFPARLTELISRPGPARPAGPVRAVRGPVHTFATYRLHVTASADETKIITEMEINEKHSVHLNKQELMNSGSVVHE